MSLASGPKSDHVNAMNEMPAKLKARAERKHAKRDEKKRQIAQSAIEALKELGYANTSLRDIAEKSDMSLGMLHYYFDDRTELIIFCVQTYKQEFFRNIIEALNKAEGRESVIEAFAESLAASIADDSMTHKLWYDIRTQAMFDEAFGPVVADIEEMLIDIVRTALTKANLQVDETVAVQYAVIDGVFRFLMQGQLGDTPRDKAEIANTFRALFAQLL